MASAEVATSQDSIAVANEVEVTAAEASSAEAARELSDSEELPKIRRIPSCLNPLHIPIVMLKNEFRKWQLPKL